MKTIKICSLVLLLFVLTTAPALPVSFPVTGWFGGNYDGDGAQITGPSFSIHTGSMGGGWGSCDPGTVIGSFTQGISLVGYPPGSDPFSSDPTANEGWMVYGSLAGVVYNGSFTMQITTPCPSTFTPSSDGFEYFNPGPMPFTGYVEGDTLGMGMTEAYPTGKVIAFEFSGMANGSFAIGGFQDSSIYEHWFGISSGTATEVYPDPPSPTPEPPAASLMLIGLPLLILLKFHHKHVAAALHMRRT
ncbi:MAG: hypothetical protein ACRD1J_06765 [Terriglobia bacterium]